MFVVASWGKLKPDTWDEYNRFFTEKLEPSTRDVKGMYNRILLRSTDEPDEGLSLAFWDNKESWKTYYQSPLRQDLIQQSEPLYTGEHWIKHFEVAFTSPRRWPPIREEEWNRVRA